jgi:hypothetical protein
MRRYDSFVVRCWGLGTADARIKVEHVQTGASARVASLAEALAWLDARAADVAAGPAGAGAEGSPMMATEQAGRPLAGPPTGPPIERRRP